MKKTHQQSNIDFRFMSLEFRLRDWLRPPSKILREAGALPGMTILDFGCGPGGFSVASARLVGPEGCVFAVDIHPLALNSIQRIIAKRGFKNIQTVFGENIADIPEGSVDIALLYDVLHDLPDPGRTLVELQRLLKPNGVLSVSDHHLKEALLLSLITGTGLYVLSGRTRWTFQFDRIKNSRTAK
jgi:ubiquinone/menaquinone biosynthesis C-methylase UbiE